jgi:hypothetical protein
MRMLMFDNTVRHCLHDLTDNALAKAVADEDHVGQVAIGDVIDDGLHALSLRGVATDALAVARQRGGVSGVTALL